MVNVNLGLCDGETRGTDGAWFDVGVVDGLVTVEVDDGFRWKTIPDLTEVPTSIKHKM